MPKPIAFWQTSDILNARKSPGGSVAYPAGWIAQALHIGPMLKANGYTRLMLHNPGGSYLRGWLPNLDLEKDWPLTVDDYARVKVQGMGIDIRYMHFDQWLTAKQVSPNVVGNDEQLLAFHLILTEQFGIEQIYYYLGSPDVHDDVYNFGLEYALKSFIRLGPKAHYVFDALGYKDNQIWLPKYKNRLGQTLDLIARLKNEFGQTTILEPRPQITKGEWLGLIAGSFAVERLDTRDWPEDYRTAGRFGEIMRMSDDWNSDIRTREWPNNITKVVRQWHVRKASEV